MSHEATALCAVVMAIGLIGTLVPVLPGLILIWATALVYGLVDGFGSLGAIAFALITLLLVVALVFKIVLPHRRGRASGAPASALVAGAVGAVAGFFLIPMVGLVAGAMVGVLGAEYVRTRRWDVAWRSTKGVAAGIGLGIALELAAGIAMVLTWGAWVRWG